MRGATITQTGIGQSNPVPVDFVQVPTNLSLFSKLLSGFAAYSIEYTEDNVFATDFNGNPTYNPATGNWFSVDGMDDVSGPVNAGFNRPVTAFRINVLNGTGTVQLQVRQGLGQ